MIEKTDILSRKQLANLHDIVCEAGQIGLSYFGKNIKNWQKPDDTPITEADLAVNDFLDERLKALMPEFGWLSEETIDNLERQNCEHIWVVDPIDGTKAFIKGMAEWVVSVAIVKDNRPILGLIYDPIAQILYYAQQGHGAFIINEQKQQVKIQPSIKDNVHEASILAYKFHFDKMTSRSNYIWPDMQYQIVNSMAMRVALVACGEFDAMVSFTNKGEWDMAAADIIIHEAGGLITDGFGQMLSYNKIKPSLPHMVAAGANLHPNIIKHTSNFNFPIDNIFNP
uniref:3'(2'),5'-bisphosphate nucleotidase CysQ n=1 Tax=OCS116 cluster bacterium TaxID=2030921 RepID=A0A2A4Z939_9PROT